MRQKGLSVSSDYGLFAPMSRLRGAYGLGQCQLGFGTLSVFGKKWEAPAVCVMLPDVLAGWYLTFAMLLP